MRTGPVKKALDLWSRVGASSPGELPPPAVRYLGSLLATAATLAVVGALQSLGPAPRSALLLYQVPVILAASRWGRGAATTAAVASVLGHDLLFVEPRGTFSITRADEALELILLLFTALVTGHLADAARRGGVTEREALVTRRSDELKTALLRAVSHNLRTPLASIKASVSALRQPGASYSSQDQAELLAEIEEEADRLNRLVTNLLDASKLDAGALKPRREPQDVRELVEAVVSRLDPGLAGREVTVSVPDTLPNVQCDYAQIEQAVLNVLENAAIHTPPGSPIRVSANADGRNVQIVVSDTGRGIPEGWRERIFRPFERGPTPARGSGLGLAIARGFVRAHGGDLWVEPGTVGGARFVVSLPLELEPTA